MYYGALPRSRIEEVGFSVWDILITSGLFVNSSKWLEGVFQIWCKHQWGWFSSVMELSKPSRHLVMPIMLVIEIMTCHADMLVTVKKSKYIAQSFCGHTVDY
jgi:hypothetical protein